MPMQLLAANPGGSVKLYWINDDDGKHTHLVIKKDGGVYRFKLHYVRESHHIGFTNRTPYKVQITTPTPSEIDLSTYPATSRTLAQQWVDQQIVALCGTEFIKSLSSDDQASILNDPTTALKLKTKDFERPVRRTVHNKASRVTVRASHDEKTGTWSIRPIHFSGRQETRFPTFKHRRDAVKLAKRIIRHLESDASDAAFLAWYKDKVIKAKRLVLKLTAGNAEFSDLVHGKNIWDTVRDKAELSDEAIAALLREKRGGQYVGVEEITDSDGTLHYRGHINLGHGCHWYTENFNNAHQAAMAYDRAYRQLIESNVRNHRFRFNHLNFFTAEMLAINVLTDDAHQALLDSGLTGRYFTVRRPEGYILFNIALRQFIVRIKVNDHYIEMGRYAREDLAVTNYDRSLTQHHKDKATTMRIGAYDDKTITEWCFQELPSPSLARVKANQIKDGINSVYLCGEHVGYRAILMHEGRVIYRSTVFSFDSELPHEQASAQQDAEQAYAAAKKRHSRGHRNGPSSAYHGVSLYSRSATDGSETWAYNLHYTTAQGKAKMIGTSSLDSPEVARRWGDQALRRIYRAGEISLSYYLARINQPNAFDISMAQFLKRDTVGHGEHKVNLIERGALDCEYDRGEVTGVIHYTDDTGKQVHVGVYAKIATAIYESAEAAHTAALKLKADYSVTLTSDDLDATHLMQLLNATNATASLSKTNGADDLSELVLEQLGRQVVDNPGQGNCLFHAFARQLQILGLVQPDGSAYTHQRLRELAVDELASHMEHYRPFIVGAADEFVWHMAAQGVWAEHLPIQALSRRLGLDVIITHNRTAMDGSAHTTVFRQNAATDTARVINLGYYEGVHYVSAEPIAADHARAAEFPLTVQNARVTTLLTPIAVDTAYGAAEPIAVEAPIASVAIAPSGDDAPAVLEASEKRPAPNDGDDDEANASTLEPARQRARLASASAAGRAIAGSHGTLFAARPFTYTVEFPLRVEATSTAVCARLSGLAYYCLQSLPFNKPHRFHTNDRMLKAALQRNAGYAINDIAALVIEHRERIGLSTRAAVAIEFLCRRYALALGVDDRTGGITRHQTGAADYLARHGLRAITATRVTNMTELFDHISDVLSSAAYGDNSRIDVSRFTACCYCAIKQRFLGKPHAIENISAEFTASFGEEAVYANATLEQPWAPAAPADDVDMEEAKLTTS